MIGSEAFKVTYTKSLVNDWIKLKSLSNIRESVPQTTYSSSVGGFKGKLAFFDAQNTNAKSFNKAIRRCYSFQLYPSNN